MSVDVRVPRPPDHLTEKERVAYVEAHELEEALYRIYAADKSGQPTGDLLNDAHRRACMLKRWIGDYRSDSAPRA